MKRPGQEGRTMKQSGARWLSMSVLGLVVWLATFLYILSIGPSEARAAEEVDITHCYSGTGRPAWSRTGEDRIRTMQDNGFG